MMLGPAGRAIAAGPESAFANPALIQTGFTASGGRWNLATTSVSVAGAFAGGASVDFGGGVTYLGKGGMTKRDEEGVVTGEYSFSTGMALTGASFSVLSWLRGGLSAGLAWQSIDGTTGTGLTLSAGIAADPSETLTAGMALTGIGSPPAWQGIRKDMPIEFSAGAAWDWIPEVGVYGGGRVGLSTSDAFCAGLVVRLRELELSAGYTIVPGEGEISGLNAGLSYCYVSDGKYMVEASVRQAAQLSWPVLAGISVRL